MKPFLPFQLPGVRRLALTLVFAIGLPAKMTHAASEEPVIEIQAQFVHTTPSELDAALNAAGVEPKATVLTPAQFKSVSDALKKAGADFFSEPRAVVQSGYRALVEEGKELRYASEYEPSKKEPGKSVPIGFETRLLGVTLDVTPSLAAGGAIQLKADSSFTRFLGFVDYSNLKPGENKVPALEDLLKAPLHAGAIWQPFFATFTGSHVFDLKQGETAMISGPLAVEERTPPSGQPSLNSNAPATTVLVLLTAKKVLRD